MYTVLELANLAGVTVRTLRHYDRIDLLKPSGRTAAGYRQYGRADAERLQQIMFYRALDFPLDQIRTMLNDPDFDRAEALKAQAALLLGKSEQYRALAKLAEDTLKAMDDNTKMEDKDMFEGFDYDKMMEKQKEYEPEVEERWGNTDAYKISKKRTASYTKEDWARIAAAQSENMNALAACFKDNVPFGDARINQVVEDARKLIDETFYPCSSEMMKCLGDMYVADERFTATYDAIAPGLAVYYQAAIHAAYPDA